MTNKQVIVLTGVSGTGKSDLSKKIANSLGFARIGMSEFFLQVAQSKGYKTLQEFNQKEGFQAAYFNLIPTFIAETQRQFGKKPGIIIDGVYDPVLYDSIRNTFRNQDVRLFNICARRRERLHWLSKREGKTPKNVKQKRDQNKQIFGVNSIMTRPEAIPIRVTSIAEAANKITQYLAKPLSIRQNPLLKTKSKQLRRKTQKTHALMRRKMLRV